LKEKVREKNDLTGRNPKTGKKQSTGGRGKKKNQTEPTSGKKD